MQKSKSWLKSLLIAVMAIMLVFSLVACNKDNNKDGPVVQETSADYFTALWNSTKPIGTAAIEEGADIAVSFGAEICIDTWDEMENAAYHQIDLGLNVQAVIGRTAATSGNTAVKIRLYDPSDAKHKEILTLYAFADDLDNLYIDFAGKNIKLPHNLESNLFEKGAAGKALANLLKNKVEIGGQERSINEIIDLVTKSFGSNWDLNSLIDSVLTLVGFDANKIFTLIREMDGGPAIEALIKTLFDVKSLEELLTDGKLDILRMMTVDNLSEILPATRQKLASGATVHRTNLSGILGMFIGSIPVIGDDANEMLSQGDNMGEVALSFSEKSGVIQDFTISAQLMGLQHENAFYDAKGNGHTLTPELSLKIKDLSIKQLASDKSNGIKIKKDNYSDTVAFDETLELAASGIKINKLDENGKDIYLNGKIIVNAKGMLDIVNTNAVIAKTDNGITANKTKANITVQLVNANDAPVTLAQVSYANGKIAGTVDSSIDLGLINENWSGKTGFVYDLGADFNVADFVQDHIASFVEGFFQDETAEVSADEANRSLARKINHVLSPAFGNLLNILTTPDNHLHIEIENILKTVVSIKECVEPGGDGAWTEANRIEAIINTLTNPPYADKSIDQCVDILEQQMEILNGDEKLDETAMKEVFTACKNAGLRILYLVAQNVRIDGVETENLSEIDIYKNNIKAVLGAEIVFDGDLQDGIHASISIKIADATLSVSTSFELVENANFFDIYETYSNASATDKAKWVVIGGQQQA